MSVSIRIFACGKMIDEEIYAGKSIKKVLNHFDENMIQYRTDKECEEARDITRNKDVKIMCIDNTNVLGVENKANFISEYMLEYNEEIHNDLKEILRETITIDSHKLNEYKFKKLLQFMLNHTKLYDVAMKYCHSRDMSILEDYFADYKVMKMDSTEMTFASKNDKPYIVVTLNS